MWPFLQTPNSACGCSSQSGTNQCGCDKISSLDVSYNGPALICSGIELCDSLTVALQKIEEKICTTGTVFGSGIQDYLARWTPNGTTLGIGLIRDNGNTIGVNTTPVTTNLFKVVGAFDTLISATNTMNGAFGSVAGNSNGTGALTNYGAFFTASNSSTLNVGTFSSAIDIIVGENIGLIASANNSLTNNYAVQLQDPSAEVGKFLKSVTYDGKASWANITTADITGFPSSIVGGSGTQDYVTRWTPNGTTLGTGVIRDNNTSVGINTAPDSSFRLVIAGNTLNGLYINTNKISSGSNTAFGINSTSSGIGSIGENVGVYGVAVNNTNVNYGVYGGSTSPTTGKNIGLRGLAGSGAAGTYAIQLQDGTQAAGKFLKSITNNGEANWANITSSDTTGATGTFTSQDGKTITVTNGLITSII